MTDKVTQQTEKLTFPKGFTQVPNVLLAAPTLTLTQKAVAIGLLRFAYGQTTVVFPSQEAIAQAVVVHRGTVTAAVKALRERRLISLLPNDGRNLKYDISNLRSDAAILKLCWPEEYTSLSATTSNAAQTDMSIAGGDDTKNTETETDTSTYKDNHTKFELSDEPVYRDEQLSVSGMDLPNVHTEALITQAPIAGGDDNGMMPEAAIAASVTACAFAVPDDEVAKGDIDAAVASCGGGVFNRGALDGLVADYGIATCWLQSKVLAYRLSRAPYRISNPTAYYVKSVKEDWTIPEEIVSAVEAGADLLTLYMDDIRAAKHGTFGQNYDDEIPF